MQNWWFQMFLGNKDVWFIWILKVFEFSILLNLLMWGELHPICFAVCGCEDFEGNFLLLLFRFCWLIVNAFCCTFCVWIRIRSAAGAKGDFTVWLCHTFPNFVHSVWKITLQNLKLSRILIFCENPFFLKIWKISFFVLIFNFWKITIFHWTSTLKTFKKS